MSDDKVKSAARAFEILEYFRLSRQPRSMSEIATALGYPLSSSTVLLKTLVKLGYLNYERRARVYFPTTKVTGLGEWIPRTLFGSGQVLDAMKDVHAATGEGVQRLPPAAGEHREAQAEARAGRGEIGHESYLGKSNLICNSNHIALQRKYFRPGHCCGFGRGDDGGAETIRALSFTPAPPPSRMRQRGSPH